MYRGRYIWWKRKRLLRRWVLHEPRTQADKTPDGKKLSINDNACRTSIYLEGLVDEEKKRGVIPRFSPSQSSSLPLRFCQIPNWQLANRLHFRLSRWSVFGIGWPLPGHWASSYKDDGLLYCSYVNKKYVTRFTTLQNRRKRSQWPLGLLLGTGKKKWPIADRHVPSNDLRNTVMHFGCSSPLVPKVANYPFWWTKWFHDK